MKKLFYLIVLLVLTSCGANRQITSFELDCRPSISIFETDFKHNPELVNDSLLTSNYSRESLIFADAYGLLPELKELEILKIEEKRLIANDSITLQRMLKEEQIEQMLYFAELEYESVKNTVSCAILQLLRAKSDLSDSNNKTRSTYTNAAIGVGVVTSLMVAYVLIENNNNLDESQYFDWVGVAGGVLAAALAIQSERTNRRIEIKHEINGIYAIWHNDNDPMVIPPTYWYLLNHPDLRNDGITWRQHIIKEWRSSTSMLGNNDNLAQLDGLLGEGYVYDEDSLQLRSDMIGVMGQAVRDIAKAIYLLNLEIG